MNTSKLPPYLIVYEDDQIIVVNKSRDVFTIHTDDKKTYHHNLYYYLSLYLRKKNESLYIVHRLDYETSGLVIFAKTLAVKKVLQNAFVKRKVTRLYEAVVREELNDSYQVGIQQKLLDTGNKVIPVNLDNNEAKVSITKVSYQNKIQIGSVLKVEIETGRRNQIRIALNSLGLTLLGDKRYSKDIAKRMYLNSYYLSFLEECNLKQSTFKLPPLWIKE